MAVHVPNTPWLPLWAWAWVLAAVLAALYMNLKRREAIWSRKTDYQRPLSVLTVLASLAALAITVSAVATSGNGKKSQTTRASPAKSKPQKPPATIPATTTTMPKVVISPPHQSRAKRPVSHRKAKQPNAAKPKIKKQVHRKHVVKHHVPKPVHRTTAPVYQPPGTPPAYSSSPARTPAKPKPQAPATRILVPPPPP
jgi:hypothetical protein